MIKVFYHNDPDGILSAAVINVEVVGKKLFFACDYGIPFPWDKIKKNDKVYMVDYSLSPKDLHKINSSCNFVWIDHHVSAIRDWKAFRKKNKVDDIRGIQRVGTAGCQLTREFFCIEEGIGKYPNLVDLIGVHDVWDKTNPNVSWKLAELATLSFLMNDWKPTSPDLINHLRYAFYPVDSYDDKAVEKFLKKMFVNGTTIKKYIDNYQNKKIQENTFDFEWEGLRWLCVNSSLSGSGQIDKKFDHSKYDAMICYYYDNKNYYYGLYTDKKIDKDLSEIASRNAFGEGNSGGGHDTASGFSSIKNIFKG